MTEATVAKHCEPARLPNGAGAAALFSAGLGAFALAVLSLIADHLLQFKRLMVFYPPTGALSGVTTAAVAVWLVSWLALHASWRRREVRGWAVSAGIFMFAVSFILMFPPIGDLF